MEAVTFSPIKLPELKWKPTKARSGRNGGHVRLVVVHRWGAPYKGIPAEALTYHGVINYFENPKHDASAHFVHPGSAVPGEATQMVALHEKAWAESFYNAVSVEIESADAIWLGHDPHGMQVLARETAFLLHHYNLAPQYITAEHLANGHTGFCRHADLGSLGGGHLVCPTADHDLWHVFVQMVIHEFHRGGFRHEWGR